MFNTWCPGTPNSSATSMWQTPTWAIPCACRHVQELRHQITKLKYWSSLRALRYFHSGICDFTTSAHLLELDLFWSAMTREVVIWKLDEIECSKVPTHQIHISKQYHTSWQFLVNDLSLSFIEVPRLQIPVFHQRHQRNGPEFEMP